MKHKRNYTFIFDGITFNENDKRGMIKNGKLCNGWESHNYINQCAHCDDGKTHLVGEHILKWIYFNGEIPEGYEIDHINGDKQDNRLSNLKCCSHKENCNNTNTKKNITSGLKKHFKNHPEDKLRLANLHKGKAPWNKGKINIYTDETIKKMSDAAKIANLKRERDDFGRFKS